MGLTVFIKKETSCWCRFTRRVGGQGQIGEGRYVAKYHMLCFAPLTCVTLCQADICLQKIKQGGAEVWFVCGRC